MTSSPLPPMPGPPAPADRVLTVLHSFPGLRSEQLGEVLGISALGIAEAIVALLQRRMISFSSERYIGGYRSTGAWNPDRALTITGAVPDWPRDDEPLAFPGDGKML